MSPIAIALLDAIRTLGTATVQDLEQHVPYNKDTIRKYMNLLAKDGYVGQRRVRREHDQPRWRSLGLRGAPAFDTERPKVTYATQWVAKTGEPK